MWKLPDWPSFRQCTGARGADPGTKPRQHTYLTEFGADSSLDERSECFELSVMICNKENNRLSVHRFVFLFDWLSLAPWKLIARFFWLPRLTRLYSGFGLELASLCPYDKDGLTSLVEIDKSLPAWQIVRAETDSTRFKYRMPMSNSLLRLNGIFRI